MIEIFPVKSRADKLSLLEGFSAQKETWLVSDLQTKYEVQKAQLIKNQYLEEEAVLRASELWTKGLKQLRPGVQWVNKDILQIYLLETLRSSSFSWAQSPGASKTLVEYMGSLLPLMAHSSSESLLRPWFENHQNSFIRWGHWYELCKYIWKDLRQKNWALRDWASALLLEALLEPRRVGGGTEFPWARDIWVDLGAQLSPLESELLQMMARNRKVNVLRPTPSWAENYTSSLWPYRLLTDEGFSQEDFSAEVRFDHLKELGPNIQFCRFATQVAEVKFAVSKVRQWMDEGVEPQNIAVVAPNIENYWPALSQHLAFEGLPVHKPVVSRLQVFSQVSTWLSRLRLLAGKLTSGDLEVGYFSESKLRYDQFRRLFRNIYDEEDLQRNHKIYKSYQKQKKSSGPLNRMEFLALALSEFPHTLDEENHLELILQSLFKNTPLQMLMGFSNWVALLETMTAKIEIEINPEDPRGIYCANANYAEYVPLRRIIYLGAMESDLTTSSAEGLSSTEALSLSQSLGFNLDFAEKAQGEFDMLWLFQNKFEESYLCTSATRFSGQVEAPSKVWIMGALFQGRDIESLDIPQQTRFDQIQSQKARQANEEGLLLDLQKSQRPSLKLNPNEVRLSVSQVEGFLKCPFIFMSRKLMGLTDLPDMDLDIDHMTHGHIMHSLLEVLMEPPFKGERSTEEIKKVVTQVLKGADLPSGESADLVQERYSRLAERFLKFEVAWRQEFPQTETLGLESEVKGFWSLENQGLHPSEGDFPFLGYIDRIDGDGEGHLCLIDYKSSEGQVRYHGSWVAQNMLQMALYTEAVEQGLVEGVGGEVAAATYFVPEL